MGNDFDLGHGSVEFEETAPHVIPGGDKSQAMKALLPHPLSGLAGIAKGVYSLVAEDDAAGGPLVARLQTVTRAAQKLLQVDVMIDARDKELLPFSVAQQRDAAIEALTAARQHDDGIGRPGAVAG